MDFSRSSGILLHPTSLPSPFGIGDLGQEAYKFIDFLQAGKQSLWQILPLGPTIFGNSPYQSFSTFAGNTLLISPYFLAEDKLLDPEDLQEAPNLPTDIAAYDMAEAVKTKLFQKAFEAFRAHVNPALEEDYADFLQEHSIWLEDYALFVAVKQYLIQERKQGPVSFSAFQNSSGQALSLDQQKDYYYGAQWHTWPENIQKRTPEGVAYYRKKLEITIAYQKFLQFIFFRQWSRLKAYANGKAIKIIGDLPIFVAADSADVWANPQLFQLDSAGFPSHVAGVPPDYFSQTGQLWGNPLYQWDAHKKEGYQWWLNRIRHSFLWCDILRIDHFRGFESYWSIPWGESTAIHGKWEKGPGLDFFQSIEKKLGSLPLIAEDLGILTPEVISLREKTGYPGMKVLQFAFDPSGKSDYLPHNYNQNCVVYTGTHDNDTTCGWYQKAPEAERDLFRRYMNVSGNDPSWDLIRLAASSTAVFAVYPMQDVLSLDSSARMNVPGTLADNWQWRYPAGALTASLAQKLSYITTLFQRG